MAAVQAQRVCHEGVAAHVRSVLLEKKVEEARADATSKRAERLLAEATAAAAGHRCLQTITASVNFTDEECHVGTCVKELCGTGFAGDARGKFTAGQASLEGWLLEDGHRREVRSFSIHISSDNVLHMCFFDLQLNVVGVASGPLVDCKLPMPGTGFGPGEWKPVLP